MTITLTKCSKSHCSPIFAEISEDEFEELTHLMMPSVRYEKGTLIFQEGEFSSGIYIICDGLVEFGKYSEDKAKKRILKLIGSKELLGKESIFRANTPARFGYAKALCDTEAVFIGREAFLSFATKHPSILINLCKRFSKDLMLFEHTITESCKTVEAKVATLLMRLGSEYGIRERSGLRIALELRRIDIARMIGASLETTIRILSKLKRKGLISFTDHEIIILDEQGLQSLTVCP